jgi:hypothetical protein
MSFPAGITVAVVSANSHMRALAGIPAGQQKRRRNVAVSVVHVEQDGYIVPPVTRYGGRLQMDAGQGARLTALHFEAAVGREDNVAQLLAEGRDVDCIGEAGRTPLHFAAAWGRAAVCAQLLSAGASGGARAADGSTPLDLAVRRGHVSVAELLGKDKDRPRPLRH